MQQLVDGFGQVAALLLRLLHARQVLTVDPAVIADGAAAVEQEDFRSPHGVELVGHEIVRILEHGEFYVVLANVGGDLLGRVLHVGVDADHANLLVGVVGGELIQPRGVQTRERALGAEEHDRDELRVLHLGQAVDLAGGIGQAKLGGLLSERRIGRQRRGGPGRKRQPRSQSDDRQQAAKRHHGSPPKCRSEAELYWAGEATDAGTRR
jgi:hypothetical protein